MIEEKKKNPMNLKSVNHVSTLVLASLLGIVVLSMAVLAQVAPPCPNTAAATIWCPAAFPVCSGAAAPTPCLGTGSFLYQGSFGCAGSTGDQCQQSSTAVTALCYTTYLCFYNGRACVINTSNQGQPYAMVI